MDLLDPSNIAFGVGMLGILFAVYRYFKDPQISEDKKAALLAQQVHWAKDSADTRFKDMQDAFQALLLQSNNHIHTVDVKVDALNIIVNTMSNEITRLSTIIEERIPRVKA